MISNFVTHLRSYTNSAIADIAETPRRYHQQLRASADVDVPSDDVVASNGECLSAL